MTARDLSKITGICTQQLSVIRNAKTKRISFESLEKLLKAFDCTPNELFNFSNDADE